MAALASGPRLYRPRDCLGLWVLSVTTQLWTFRLPRGPASRMGNNAEPIFAHTGVLLALSGWKGEGSRGVKVGPASRSSISSALRTLHPHLFIVAI